jgi:hypothetical protein
MRRVNEFIERWRTRFYQLGKAAEETDEIEKLEEIEDEAHKASAGFILTIREKIRNARAVENQKAKVEAALKKNEEKVSFWKRKKKQKTTV